MADERAASGRPRQAWTVLGEGCVGDFCGSRVCTCQGVSARRYWFCLGFVFVPLYLVWLILSVTGHDIASLKATKYAESREYAFEKSEAYELPGFGFAFNGTVDMEVSAMYPSLGATKMKGRTMFYVYICDYAEYLELWANLLGDGRRPQRAQGVVTEDRATLCKTKWYNRGNVGSCQSFPLLPVENSTTDLYLAQGTISAQVNHDPAFAHVDPRYFTVLLMNCELNGYPGSYSRDCDAEMYQPPTSEGILPENNCTIVPHISSDGTRISVQYTYKNLAPLYYLSSTQEPFLTIYTVSAVVWILVSIVWVVNTYAHRRNRGIDLQWHCALFITMKPINLLYKLLFWNIIRVGQGDRHLFMVLTLTMNCFYYCFLWETMMRISHGWMITKYRLTNQARFHLYFSIIVWAFGNFVFSYFYQYSGEGLGIVRIDLTRDVPAYYLVAFALLATGISYTIILMTVCLSTSNLSHLMSDQLLLLQNLGMASRGTFVANRKKVFVNMSIGFTSYLLASFVTWFVVIAIPDSPILFPWLNDMVDESLECIFLWWVLWTFRARKFNNVALVSPTGEPLPGQYELAASAPGNTSESAASTRICILNPVDDNPERPNTKRSISIGVPADMSNKADLQK